MKDVLAVLSGMAALVIALTVIGRGNFSLGTSSSGPYANFGYRGY